MTKQSEWLTSIEILVIMAEKPNMEKEFVFAEYNASEIRELLVQLFPYRKLVLSQFTFFNNEGVSQPTGNSFRRGRRCYRLQDVLSIACVLALKEGGIPLRNIQQVPAMIQANADRILEGNDKARLTGYGLAISLGFGDEASRSPEVDMLLSAENERLLFWSYDVSALAMQLKNIATGATEKHQVAA